jgi:nucleoside-diphosphate-sugar epimerase
MNCLAITGVPGWLTQALLDDLGDSNLDRIRKIKAFVHPGLLDSSGQIAQRNPILNSIHPLDLRQPGLFKGVQDALRDVDVLLHAAGAIHVQRTADWYRINLDGTLYLARAARAAGVRRFVFISSNAAGGRCGSAAQVLTESDLARPLSHYGRSKWLAEQGLAAMQRDGEFDVVILRPSMFYGPPVPERHVDVYRRILAGRMPMVGDGRYRRSITYIDNLVQATRLAMTHPDAPGEVFYVVDEPVYTTRRIAESMASALAVPLRLLRFPALVGPAAYFADRALASIGLYWQNLHVLGESHWHVALSCGKIKRRLGYQPRVEIDEGMRRAVEWCRQHGKL